MGQMFKAGEQVDILMQGQWQGPYRVVGDDATGTPDRGRTTDHLVLSGPSGTFEHYNDAPFNTRRHGDWSGE